MKNIATQTYHNALPSDVLPTNR